MLYRLNKSSLVLNTFVSTMMTTLLLILFYVKVSFFTQLKNKT